ncbi:TPA: hypothetical protein PXM28_002379 [Yersinia enterocolitica]|nr:hypothetical protein [Yersinia enterocolitica]
MNYRIKKILLSQVLLLISPLSYAVVAGGIVAINHSWPANSEFNKLSFFQQISNDGGTDSHYYWANQFFLNKGMGGILVYKTGAMEFMPLITLSGKQKDGRAIIVIISITKVQACNARLLCRGKQGISTN